MFSLLIFLVFGFIVGLIARALLPGAQKMGIVRTTLIGIAGSFIGGLIGNIIAGNAMRVQSAGWIGSIIGAIVLMIILGRR
jgi:uncharacterized membrane protein YeaQ/YmgE (transglycosylase-associated protein family)